MASPNSDSNANTHHLFIAGKDTHETNEEELEEITQRAVVLVSAVNTWESRRIPSVDDENVLESAPDDIVCRRRPAAFIIATVESKSN